MIDFSKINDFERRLPASDERIAKVENQLGKILPSQYKELLKNTDGFYSNEAHLYSTDLLVEQNQIYEIDIYCPEYINIGDDGGDCPFLIKHDDQDSSVYMVGHDAIDTKHGIYEKIGDSLIKWIENGCPLSE